MKYQFQNAEGFVVEQDFAAFEVPDFVDVNGICYTRLEGPSPDDGSLPAVQVREDRHVAYTLPRLWQSPNLGKIWGKFDDHGRVLCEGKRDRVELSAKMAATPEFAQYAWDTGANADEC